MKTLISLFLLSLSASIYANNTSEEYYKVTSVANDDTLNIRASASSKSKTLFKLPHNAYGILKLDETNNWIKISYKNINGWAYKKYLAISPAPKFLPLFKKELKCYGTEPHWILTTQQNAILYQLYDNKSRYLLNSSIVEGENKFWSMSAIKNNENIVLGINVKQDQQCNDSMSDAKFNYKIIVKDHEMGDLHGCCK